MKLKLLVATSIFIPTILCAQTGPSLQGSWIGTSNAAVGGSGLFHPSEKDKEGAIRFRHVEYQLWIEKQEGRNFAGYIGATNKGHVTDLKHREVILGAFAKDMKSGVAVNESGRFTFQITDPKTMEICYTQVTPHESKIPLVASCFELTKQ